MKYLLSMTALGCTATLACGGAATQSAPANASDSTADRGRVACPGEPALTALARTQFAAASGEIGVTCVAVDHGGPRWLLDGWHDPGDADGIAFVQALVDARTGVGLWTTGAGDFGFPAGAIDRITADAWTAVDLDGDGGDELIHVNGTGAQGYEQAALDVLRLTDHGLEPAGSVGFAEDNTAADEDPAATVACQSTWQPIAGPAGATRLELMVTSTGAVAGACLTPGRHVLTWNGTELVEER